MAVVDPSSSDEQASFFDKLNARLSGRRLLLSVVLIAFSALWLSGSLSGIVAALCATIVMFVALIGSSKNIADTRSTKAIDAAPVGVDATLPEGLEQQRMVLAAMPMPVAIIGSSFDVVTSNGEFDEIYDSTAAGRSVFTRFRNPDFQNAVRRAMQTGQTARAEFADKGRLNRWFEVTVAPIAHGTTRPDHSLIFFRDLSDARRLDKVRTDFVGNASHELRTPLASLKGYLETLSGAARNDPAARERFIGIMLEQAERMERLIDDLLSLSRFETGFGRGSFKTVDISDALFHIRSALAPLAEQLNVNLEFDDEALLQAPLLVRGNSDELIQLFENLVENAIKYGDAGTAVTVTVKRDNEFGRPVYRVLVTDNGPGIAPEHIPRLTERFYRVDVQSSRERRGTGLGLAIVKHILTRHDGMLAIKSQLGQGSTFIATMPAVDL